MHGQIAELLRSNTFEDQTTVREVFCLKFHDFEKWKIFLNKYLSTDVSAKLKAPANTWRVKSFQALFIACWVHHPVEKGTFMIDLSGLTQTQRDNVKKAYKDLLYGRKSSHLSGSGRSASKGWKFLNGYHELLVQWEETAGVPYLMLKAEGHTTGIKGIVPHLNSWAHKKKHGVGITASHSLNELGNRSNLVEGRAAENYSTAYKDLLKLLGHHGKKVTIREMMTTLFEKTRYQYTGPPIANSNNNDVAKVLQGYIDNGSRSVGKSTRDVTDDMIGELKKLVATFEQDGAIVKVRVFREIRVKPADIDSSLKAFRGFPNA